MHPIKALKAKFDLPLKFWVIALIAFINSVSFTIILPILYPYAKQAIANKVKFKELMPPT